MSALAAVCRFFRKGDPCLDFSGGGRVRVRDLRYYTRSPKVQRQVAAARAMREREFLHNAAEF